MRTAAERSAARLELLSRASRAFSERSSGKLPELLETVAEQLSGSYADACGVALVSESGETLELAAVRHKLPEIAQLAQLLFGLEPVRIGEGLTGRVAATGEPLLISEVDRAAFLEAAHPAHRSWVERHTPRSLIIVCLRVRGRIIGTLAATREQGSPAFGEEDLRLVAEIAERAAVAIETCRLYRDNQHGRLRAELLYDMAEAVIRAEDIDTVFAAALDAIERALGTPRSAILTFDEQGVMRFRAFRGLSEHYRASVEGHSPWPRTARAPEPILVRNVEGDAALAQYESLFRAEDIAALGFVPLLAGGRLIGKFMVYYDAPRDLSKGELELARGIANHVAAAVVRFSTLEELQRTIRFNEMFTGILGHDLRNPLGAILTAAHVVANRHSDDERIVKPLARIRTSGTRMARMIDQLLDFTRVRVGSGMPLAPSKVDLPLVVRQVIEELELGRPGAKIALEIAGSEPHGLWDADRLLQVFSNLIANALQHGAADDGVRILIDLTSKDSVRVRVQNQGLIEPALLAKIFEPMTGGDRRHDKSQGLGLGLYISQEIVRAHHGRIEVSSTAESGTVFIVTMPRCFEEVRT
jgi:signal transduction histidine kinase